MLNTSFKRDYVELIYMIMALPFPMFSEKDDDILKIAAPLQKNLWQFLDIVSKMIIITTLKPIPLRGGVHGGFGGKYQPSNYECPLKFVSSINLIFCKKKPKQIIVIHFVLFKFEPTIRGPIHSQLLLPVLTYD